MATTMTRAQEKLRRTAAAASGATSVGSSSTRRAATAQRRRPAFIALAVLLIVGSAAAAALLAVHLDDRVPVLVAARTIPAGTQITRADLATADVAADGLSLVPASEAGRVVGTYAGSQIPAGRLIDTAMTTPTGYLTDGKVAVGVTMTSGRVPASGLQSGDVVRVVSVGQGSPTVLVDKAVVSSTSTASSSGSIVAGAGEGSAGVATLIVAAADGPKVAAASAQNQVALVLVSRAGA